MSDQHIYIVRGAKMRCDHGSHARKINLPISHGTYYKDKPLMNEGDCAAQNISYFGVCKSPKNPSTEIIYLVGEDGKTVEGKPCLPVIPDKWTPVKEDTQVEGLPALTQQSCLICEYKGCIRFETTGQEEES